MKKIECKISDELAEDIEIICKRGGFTYAEFARRALESEIEEYQKAYKLWFLEPMNELTEEQKSFITKNSHTMDGLELAQKLFKNTKLNTISVETRAVRAYQNFLKTNV